MSDLKPYYNTDYYRITGDYVVYEGESDVLKKHTPYRLTTVVCKHTGSAVYLLGDSDSVVYGADIDPLPHRMNMIYKAAEVFDRWRKITDFYLYKDLLCLVCKWEDQYPRKHWKGLLRFLEEYLRVDYYVKKRQEDKDRYGYYGAALKAVFDGKANLNDIGTLILGGAEFISKINRHE